MAASANIPAAPPGAPRFSGSPKRLAVLAGRVHTVRNGTITDGVVLIEDGKITQVGPRDAVKFVVRRQGHHNVGVLDLTDEGNRGFNDRGPGFVGESHPPGGIQL